MKTPQPGFTLLEVVVATALLGIGIAVAMQVFTGGIRNIYRIEEAHRAMNHAENVMNEVLADADIRDPYQDSGDLDEDFSYEVTVDYWENAADAESLQPLEGSITAGPRVYLLSIVVDINFKDSRRGRRYRLTSLKAVAEQTDPGDIGAESLRRLFQSQ
ncbi:MAG TPA: type II secretion system protein [Acidobacteriota bacterium]|nr:type II secretion system protein [Acidobacteriota bacterium]